MKNCGNVAQRIALLPPNVSGQLYIHLFSKRTISFRKYLNCFLFQIEDYVSIHHPVSTQQIPI